MTAIKMELSSQCELHIEAKSVIYDCPECTAIGHSGKLGRFTACTIQFAVAATSHNARTGLQFRRNEVS